MEESFEAFTVLISKISRSIKRLKAGEMAQFKLRGTHVSCLYYLFISGSLTASELCERCEEDKAAVSRSIDYLETNGYIVCSTTAAKRYKSPLRLTEKGQELGRAVSERIERIVAQASCGLDEAERESMYRALTVRSDNLERIREKEKLL